MINIRTLLLCTVNFNYFAALYIAMQIFSSSNFLTMHSYVFMPFKLLFIKLIIMLYCIHLSSEPDIAFHWLLNKNSNTASQSLTQAFCFPLPACQLQTAKVHPSTQYEKADSFLFGWKHSGSNDVF